MATEKSKIRKLPVLGHAAWKWPEVDALLKRLEVPTLKTKAVTIRIAHDEAVSICQEYLATDAEATVTQMGCKDECEDNPTT